MDQNEKMPKRSYELIEWLDKVVREDFAPKWPTTANEFYRFTPERLAAAAFNAGNVALIDQLVAMMHEELAAEGEDVEDVSDGPEVRYPRLFSADGDICEITPSSRVVTLTSK